MSKKVLSVTREIGLKSVLPRKDSFVNNFKVL